MTPDDLWCRGTVECITCGHFWIGVWALGCPALTCPNCEGTDTERTAETHRAQLLLEE